MAIAVGAATIAQQNTEWVDGYGERKIQRILLDNTTTGTGLATVMTHWDSVSNAYMSKATFAQEAVVTGQRGTAVIALQDKVREQLVLTFVAPFPGAPNGKKIKQVIIPAPAANTYTVLPNGGSAVDTTNTDVAALVAFYATHLQFEVRDPATGAISYQGGFVFDPTRSGLATAGDVIDGI